METKRQRVSPVSPFEDGAVLRPGQRIGDYRVLHALGRGGTGAVYAAENVVRDCRVALKTLFIGGPEAVRALKREFRAAARLSHPNIVALHELVLDGPVAFFAMELVRGVSLTEFASTDRGRTAAVRRILPALVDAVSALHNAGVLHLDLKPANVLVESSGRLVIVDFGFAKILSSGASDEPEDSGLTPAYASPERLLGRPCGADSDWYSVGVMLCEALRGERPFLGRFSEQVAQKLRGWTAPADGLDAPTDLTDLCVGLLRPNPAERLGGPTLRARVGLSAGGFDLGTGELIGRARELEVLADATSTWLAGACVRVWIRGAAGVGKTALVSTLAARLELEVDRSLVLTSRCRRMEELPYNVIDGWVDDLLLELERWPAAELTGVLPADLESAARLFPSLERLVERAPSRPSAPRDPAVVVAELFRNVALQRRLVLVAEDLHWGDQDSAHVFMKMFAGAPTIPALFVGTLRDPVSDRGYLAKLERSAARAWMRGTDIDLDVGPLRSGAAVSLAKHLLQKDDAALAASLASAAEGVPARMRLLSIGWNRSVDVPFAEAVGLRLSSLSAPALRIVRFLATARGPLMQGTVLAAAGAEQREGSALQELRRAELVHYRRQHPSEPLELEHAALGEIALAQIGLEARRELQLNLAQALELRGQAATTRVRLYRDAEQPRRAAMHAERAAHTYVEALAFDRGAELFLLALEWDGWPEDDVRRLLAACAEALARCGRLADSGFSYAALVERTGHAGSRRRAAEQLLASGHLDAGMVHLEHLLAELNVSLPQRSSLGMIRSTLALLHARRKPDRASRQTDHGAELFWLAARSLIATDFVRGAHIAVAGLARALAQGNANQAARFSALVGGAVVGPLGGAPGKWGKRLLAETAAFATQTHDTELLGTVDVLHGQLALVRGDWSAALRRSEEGQQKLHGAAHARFEVNVGRMGALRAAEELGRYDYVSSRSYRYMRDARAVEDRYAVLTFAFSASLSCLASGRAGEAARLLERAAEEWSHDGFHIQHLYACRALARIALYEGEPARAEQRLEALWPSLRRSQMLRVPVGKIDALTMRARVGLALADHGDASRLGRAHRDAAALCAISRPDARGLGALLLGGCAGARGDRDAAEAHYVAAVREFDAAAMDGLRACAQVRLAGIRGNRAAERVALQEIDAAGAQEPRRWVAMFAPGVFRNAR